ncbi:hypothetical protein NQ315_002769 [Exocentrus adspersus]|uniref:VWFD domain-containing protein n=1 Tax=Exocentrus adspersus TaxID=1586481 RepID=A0AAV8VKL0_9CUCU|nr:hypothetical protein NQ315_002769 [Exocentrus adspersus]
MERLPTQIGDSYIHQHSDILIVGSSSGFTLECNLKFHICVFEMSGWYFGKTAGLLGTYNNEPSDDFTTRYKSRLNITDINTFGESWHVNNTCEMTTSIADHTSVHTVPKNIINLCSEFFASKVSQLNTCFPKIPKESFMNMCLSSTNEKDACISAVSYMNLCSYANVPLRIPDTCVTCDLLNGTRIKEGEFVRLQGSEVPRSVDVVFIIEAKECNKDITKSKNFGNVAELLDKELTELKLTQNRYAVVVFGGDGVFDEPRNMIIDGNVFTTSKFVSHYLNNLPTGNGNKDIFNAIIFAYNLIFRPGVSRCFILLPCSECNKYYMEHDYSTVHQLLSEGAVTLNVIMNDYFTMQKEREVKTLFGIDKRYVYTKRDTKEFIRDQVLRKSIILPKSTLGPCLSLILETNGTVFSGKYLETDKKTSKKMSTVFAKAVGQKIASSAMCGL